jgi:aerobic carbon-monoxide dehydrogenase medium subunit
MYTMRPAEFEYHRPGSLDEALALLGEESRPLAGGHSLLPLMKMRLSTPEALVDLADVPGLDEISEDGDGLRVGALATHASVAASELVRSRCPVLAETAALIGDAQVRNRGTLGGSVAHADPAADYPTVLTALGATISVAGGNGEREIAAGDFFVGMFATALQPGELVVAAKVPALPTGTGAAYVKHRHPASFYAVVGVAAVVTVENGTCTNARLTIGGVTGSPVDATAAAEAVVGAAPPEESAAAAADKVAEALPNAMSDTYASGEYRTHLAGLLTKAALQLAFERAG